MTPPKKKLELSFTRTSKTLEEASNELKSTALHYAAVVESKGMMEGRQFELVRRIAVESLTTAAREFYAASMQPAKAAESAPEPAINNALVDDDGPWGV